MEIQAIKCVDASTYKVGTNVDIITEKYGNTVINENEFYIIKDGKIISVINGHFVVSVEYIVLKPEPTPTPTKGESRQ